MNNVIIQIFIGALVLAGFILIYLVIKMGEKR